jgi:ABC-type uncharacterized transport system substrate-binding protein
MTRIFWERIFGIHSDNLESKTCTELSRSIQNLKWIVLATFCLTTLSIAEAQQETKVRRIGFLSALSPPPVTSPGNVEAFKQGLRALGWVEGQNIAIEYRWAEGKYDRLPDLAAELVRLNVDVIVTNASRAATAAKQATSTIPIVFEVNGGACEYGIGRELGSTWGKPHRGVRLWNRIEL